MYTRESKEQKGTFMVCRRYSDFEYLLKKLQENEKYKGVGFPELPPKKMIGNMDDQHIEKRRLELEGFLRVLTQIDEKVKTDPLIFAFLTYDSDKWADFKENPSPYIDKVWTFYNSLPDFRKDIQDISQRGMKKKVKEVFKRVKTEFNGIQEPEILLKDANKISFDECQKTLEKNLIIFQQA